MPDSQFDLRSYHIQKTKDEDEAKTRQAARKRVELEWNRDLRHVIDRYQAATPSTIAACLGVNPKPETPHERTALRQLYRRLERNAFHGRFRAQYEYSVEHHGEDVPKDRRRKYAGKVWYVSLDFPRREGSQYEHKALIAHVRGTLERLERQFQLLKTDTELRDAKPPLVYDLYGRLHGQRLAIECNLSDGPTAVSDKCLEWKRHMENDRFDFPFMADRYLWVVETEQKARNIHQQWIKDGLKTVQFWVTWKDQFTPYQADTILGSIWLRPDTDELQAL
jgi:hypothetical protein